MPTPEKTIKLFSQQGSLIGLVVGCFSVIRLDLVHSQRKRKRKTFVS